MFNSQFLTFFKILSKFVFLNKLIVHSINSKVLCSCIFFTSIVFDENGDRLNSDLSNEKFVIFFSDTLIFSPLKSSNAGY